MHTTSPSRSSSGWTHCLSRSPPKRHGVLGIALAVLATVACRGPAVEDEGGPEPSPSEVPLPSEVFEQMNTPRSRATGPMTIRTRNGKIIFYPVQSGRAEELAQTLLPFVEAEYGPDARIVPHVQTNQLMIYVPDRRGDDNTRRPR